jgi:hypothetical protein
MNNVELQALRRLLFYSTLEAATLVAASLLRPQGVSERAWRHWEDGVRAVPDDVAEKIITSATWRNKAIEAAAAVIRENSRANMPETKLIWYSRIVDWVGEPIFWRPHQSACAAIFAATGTVDLVLFDSVGYSAWLGDQADSEKMRGAWAARELFDK